MTRVAKRINEIGPKYGCSPVAGGSVEATIQEQAETQFATKHGEKTAGATDDVERP